MLFAFGQRPVLGAWLIGILLTSSCALSPQTVQIRPVVEVPAQDIGRGRNIALEVRDLRPTKAFGTRGGVYGTATIDPQGDITVPIRNSLAGTLYNYNFVVVQPGTSAPMKLNVNVDAIRYTPMGELVGQKIRTDLTLSVGCHNGKQGYQTRYSANTEKQVVTAPSAEENEAMLNELLSKGLKRMLSDPGLLGCLRG